MMTTFLDPAAADAAARAQLAAQAQSVTGTPSAGIFGDVAGAGQPAQPLNLGAASRTEIDAEALLATLQRQQQQIDKLLADQEAERIAAQPVPSEPPDIRPLLGNASGELKAALMGLHDRLVVLELALSARSQPAPARPVPVAPLSAAASHGFMVPPPRHSAL